MASEVTSNKSHAARPSLSDSLSAKTQEKSLTTSQGNKSGQDFLAALDKAAEQKTEKPKIQEKIKSNDKSQKATKSDERSTTKVDRDLSRVKPPKLNAAKENQTGRRDPESMDKDAEISGRDEAKPSTKPTEQKTVKDVVAAHKESIADSPVVAFLTGHLEKLDAAQIPTLVAGNDFVQTALSEPDIEQFMQQPMKVSELFESLGLPKNLTSQASLAGLDLEQVITPRTFFKDLGIDPQRVSVELQLLRDNLALGGVSMYMGRAQTLKSPDELVPTNNPPGMSGPKGPDPLTQSGKSKLSSPPVDIENLKIPSVGTASGPQSKAANVRLASEKDLAFDAIASLDESLLEETALEQGPQSLAYVLAAQDLLRGFAGKNSAMAISSEIVDGSVGPMATRQDVLPKGLQLSQAEGADLKNLGPTTHAATFDAWRTLGDTLKGADTESLRFDLEEPIRPTNSSPSSIGDLRLTGFQQVNKEQNPDNVLRAPWIVAQENILKEPGSDPLGQAAPMGSPWGESGSISQMQSVSFGPLGTRASSPSDLGKKPADLSSPLFERGAEVLAASIQSTLETARGGGDDLSSNSRQQGDQGSERGSERSISAEGLSMRAMSLDKAPLEPLGQNFTDALTPKSAESTMTPAQRAHLVQQVIDRTAMLTSQGGGTVRLDLSSADLGRMELAVAMDEGRVNLRVLTGSDGMRSAILSDMTRLKDALGLQNIQLGLVEVGVVGQQTSSGGQGFAGQGSFDQRRDFSREDFSRAMAQSIGSRNVSRAPASEISQPSPLAPAETLLGNGRISLRI